MTNDLKIFDDERKKVSFIGKNPETIEDKKALYNSLENCDKLLNDCVGEELNLVNVYAERYEAFDEKSQELKPKFRTILMTKEGISYATGSYGAFNSVMKIISIYGSCESWSEPVKVKVIKKDLNDGKKSLGLTLV